MPALSAASPSPDADATAAFTAPVTAPLTPDAQAVVQRVLAECAAMPGALLPILHGVQQALGHVPRQAMPVIAAALNLSRAEVHGVVSYYHHFRTQPAGRCVVQLCRAESCQARGAEALWAHACATLGCSDEAPTSADSRFTLEPVYCLGLCASSPAVRVGERLHARMTPTRFDALIGRTGRTDRTTDRLIDQERPSP